jgi:hypothetical protein
VTRWLDEARGARWEPSETVGAGQEYRTELNDRLGTALLLDTRLVHGSVIARMA